VSLRRVPQSVPPLSFDLDSTVFTLSHKSRKDGFAYLFLSTTVTRLEVMSVCRRPAKVALPVFSSGPPRP